MPTVYVTAPRDAATELAATLVEERLAACVNQVPCHSMYRWEDEMVTDEETILLCKTTDEAYERVRERVLELHPHEVPCIERLEESDVLESFAAWREDAVR